MTSYSSGQTLETLALVAQAHLHIWLLLNVRTHNSRLSLWASLGLVLEALVRALPFFFPGSAAGQRVFERWRASQGPSSPGQLMHLLTETEDAVRVACRLATLAWAVSVAFWGVAAVVYFDRRGPAPASAPVAAVPRFQRIVLGVVCIPVLLSWVARSCVAEFATELKFDGPSPALWHQVPARVQMCASGPFGASDGVATVLMLMTWIVDNWNVEWYLVGKLLVVMLSLSGRVMQDVSFSRASGWSVAFRGLPREALLQGCALQFLCLGVVLVPHLYRKRRLALMLLLSVWVGCVWLSRALGEGLLGRFEPTTDLSNVLVSAHLLSLFGGGVPSMMVVLGLGNVAMEGSLRTT